MFTSLNARAAGLDLAPVEAIELAAEAGFGGVDLMVRDLVDAGLAPAAIRRRMEDSGLKGGAFPLPMQWRGSEAEFVRDLDRLPKYADAAAALGLQRTGSWVMPETPRRPATDEARVAHWEETVALHVKRLGAIARVLAARDIRLGLEVIGVETSRTGSGWPFVHRLNDLDRVLGAVWNEAPNLGILVDAFHLYAAGEPIEAGFAWGGSSGYT